MPGYEFHGYYKKEDRFDKHLKLRGVLLEQKKIENAKKRFFHLHTKLTGQKCCQVCHSDDISIASIHHSVEIGVWYKSYKNEKTGYYDQAGYYGALLEWLKNNPKNAKILWWVCQGCHDRDNGGTYRKWSKKENGGEGKWECKPKGRNIVNTGTVEWFLQMPWLTKKEKKTSLVCKELERKFSESILERENLEIQNPSSDRIAPLTLGDVEKGKPILTPNQIDGLKGMWDIIIKTIEDEIFQPIPGKKNSLRAHIDEHVLIQACKLRLRLNSYFISNS